MIEEPKQALCVMIFSFTRISKSPSNVPLIGYTELVICKVDSRLMKFHTRLVLSKINAARAICQVLVQMRLIVTK